MWSSQSSGTGSLKDWDLVIGLQENPLPQHLTTTIYYSSFHPVPHVQLSRKKISRHAKRQKHNLNRHSKPQNQIWQGYWNYQIGKKQRILLFKLPYVWRSLKITWFLVLPWIRDCTDQVFLGIFMLFISKILPQKWDWFYLSSEDPPSHSTTFLPLLSYFFPSFFPSVILSTRHTLSDNMLNAGNTKMNKNITPFSSQSSIEISWGKNYRYIHMD